MTTSSCAGRFSVYLDGEKGGRKDARGEVGEEEVEDKKGDKDEKWEGGGQGDEGSMNENVKSGGKGGGRWLFVSHDPVQTDDSTGEVSEKKYTELFGMQAYDGQQVTMGSHSRLIHFKFEPMVSLIITHHIKFNITES